MLLPMKEINSTPPSKNSDQPNICCLPVILTQVNLPCVAAKTIGIKHNKRTNHWTKGGKWIVFHLRSAGAVTVDSNRRHRTFEFQAKWFPNFSFITNCTANFYDSGTAQLHRGFSVHSSPVVVNFRTFIFANICSLTLFITRKIYTGVNKSCTKNKDIKQSAEFCPDYVMCEKQWRQKLRQN